MVERGDTLFEIAQRYGTTLRAFVAANPEIDGPDVLLVGQRLEVPGGPPEPPADGGDASVRAMADRAAPGEAVRIVVRGFPPNTRLHVGAGRIDSEYEVLGQVTTDARGRAEADVRLPEYADPRERWVFAASVPGSRLDALSQPVDVRGAAAEGP